MKRIRPITRFAALLLLLLTLHTLAYSVALPNFALFTLEEQAVCTALLTDNGAEQTHEDDCKPPKHSFIDYSSFLYPNYLFPTYSPDISRLLSHKPFQVMPQVYLEINVPPDNLA